MRGDVIATRWKGRKGKVWVAVFCGRGLLSRRRSFELKGLCASGLKRDASGGAFEV